MALPDWIGRTLRWLAGGAALVSTGAAVFAAVVVPYRFWDSLAFGAWSRSIASGGGLWFDTPALFRQRPLFYVAQGLLWRVSGDEWLGRLLSLSFAAAFVVAVYLLARALSEQTSGRALLPPLALVVALGSSVLATYAAAGMSDVPVAALVAATAAAAWTDRPGGARIGLITVCAGAAVLAKPTALLAFAGLLPALALLRGRTARYGIAGLAAGVAAALAYDVWQAHRMNQAVTDFLTAGNDEFWRSRGAAARWDALARAEWFGAGLRLVLLFGLVHAVARLCGARSRVALSVAAGIAIVWSVVGPAIADDTAGYPFSWSPIGIVVWLALSGSMVTAAFVAQEDPVSPRTYGALLVWLAPMAIAWAWQRADEVRHLAPVWAPLVLVCAAALGSASLALARLRPALALCPAVALTALALSNLVSIDGLGRSGWHDLLDLGPSGWSSRSQMENFAFGPFSYELDLARANVGSEDRIVSSNGRLSYFFPGRVDIGYARTCEELGGARFFSFLTSGESLEFAERAGQPTDPLGWLQCTRPRVRLVGEQLGIYAAFVVGAPPTRKPTLDDCHIAPTAGQLFDAVFGEQLSYSAAKSLTHRALASGFAGTHVEQTGCSTFRVVVTGVPAASSVRRELRSEIQRVGLSVRFVPAVRYPEVSPDVTAVP
jgi:hypothetical protein